jgi:peptide-methionine (S)-S-oxide reductase
MKNYLWFAVLSAATLFVVPQLMTPYFVTEAGAPFPDAAIDLPAASGKQTAVFAGGCFWCTEAVFEQLEGVEKVISGYAGGDANTAKYEIVGSGRTKHAEAIEITYDPSKITYGQLLKVFFAAAHDPTQLNRQGPDWGPQYRSAVFYATPQEKNVVEAYIKQLTDAKAFSKPIVTEVAPLEKFYPAETYHQDFVKRNPSHPYVVVNSVPKVNKAKKEFPELIRKK